MYNTPNLVLISLLLVVAIIAVGSLLFINTRPEVPHSANLGLPVNVPVTEPTPDPTPNNQVFLPTTTSILPTTVAKTREVTSQANNNNNNNNNLAVPAPSPTSNVSSNPANVNNENDNESDSELVTVSNNNVIPLTLSELQRLSIDDIRKALFIHTLYIQNVYNLKAENGWTTIDSYSDVNIETAINNYKLIINQLRVMGLLSEVDFYKAMGYSEIYYNCSINPNSSQCKKNYTLDGELPLRYDPTYKDLNYTFARYESEIILPELNRLQRLGRRYDFKYLQLRTGEDKAVYNSTVTQASSENNTNNSPAANNGSTNNQANQVNNSGNNGVNQANGTGNNGVNNSGNNGVNNSGNNGVNQANETGNNQVNGSNNGVTNNQVNGSNNGVTNNQVNNAGNNQVNNSGNNQVNGSNNGVSNNQANQANGSGNNQVNGAGNNQSQNQGPAPAPAPTGSSVNGNPF